MAYFTLILQYMLFGTPEGWQSREEEVEEGSGLSEIDRIEPEGRKPQPKRVDLWKAIENVNIYSKQRFK